MQSLVYYYGGLINAISPLHPSKQGYPEHLSFGSANTSSVLNETGLNKGHVRTTIGNSLSSCEVHVGKYAQATHVQRQVYLWTVDFTSDVYQEMRTT